MNIAELKTAGFDEQEIGEYVSDKRNTLLQSGFDDTEINNYFGIDSNAPEFQDMVDPNAVSEKTGKIWDKGFELGVPTDIVKENYNDIFNITNPSEPSEMPLKEVTKKEEPEEFVIPEFHVAPEQNDLMERIFGYEGLPKPESYWAMNPIKRAAFDAYMAGRNLLTRTGGMIVRQMGVANTKEVQDLYNDELINNPKWYNYSPEVTGFAAEQAAEFYAMKGLWKVTRLNKLFNWGRTATTKLVAPFLMKEITVRGGTEVLPVLSKEGLKRLGIDTTISFLKNAPENIAFLETWSVGKAALTDEDKSEAAWAALLWSGGFSIFSPAAGAGSKIFMATSAGEKVKTAAEETYKQLWINFPRMMNAGRKPFSDEYFVAAKKWFKNQFGYYPNPAEEAQLKEATRRVGQKVTEAAEKNAATNAYWNSGVKEAKVVASQEVAQPKNETPIQASGKAEIVNPEPTGEADAIAKSAQSATIPSMAEESAARNNIPSNQQSMREGGDTVYHGTEEDITADKVTPDQNLKGIYTTTSKEAAQTYGKNVFAYKVNPDAKVLDLSDGEMLWQFMKEKGILEPEQIDNVDLQNYVKNGEIFQYDISSKTRYADDVVATAKSLGYDIVNIPDRLPESQDNIAIIIINKSAIAPQETAEAGKGKTVDDLYKEARKHKSAEEFISFMRGSATQYRDYNPKLRATVGLFEDSARISDLGIDPEMEVTVYRGVPDAKTNKIIDGDFVTVDKLSAESYAGKENVVSKKVKAKDLITDTVSDFDKSKPFGLGAEFVYSDSKNKLVNYTEPQLTNIWNQSQSSFNPPAAEEGGKALTTKVKETTGKTKLDISSVNSKSIDAVNNAILNQDAETLKKWLHKGNKTLRKYFTEKTGIKLPNTERDTKTAIDDWVKSTKPLSAREDINAQADIEGQGKIDEFLETIKKPKRIRGKLEPGMVDVSGVTEAVKEVIDNGITYVKETFETGKDAIEALKFYPSVPMELRNSIRTDIIGAGNQAGHRIYGVLSPNLMGSLPREDIEKAAQIFYAKDEIARTKAGKGNPDLTLEDAQAIHDELVAGASPEVLKVVENLAKIQKTYTDVLMERGLIDPDNALDDYARHYVLDYTPDWAFKRGLPPMKLRTPFRGYTKKATGTTKEYARTMESILFSFYEKELDNIVADFIEEQTAKYNILPTLSKEKKITLFGANKRGTPNKPKPGRIVDIDGKRYKSFSPDAPFARTFYRTENGEMAMGGLKHISVIPEDIYNAFNSFSQRGGAIIYRINQVTRLWKSMAILSHYTGFTLNNIIGDTLVAVMQHPEPGKFIAEYSTALKYLTGKGEGQFYKDLEKFITDNDIVKGQLTTTELAHFKNNANPFNVVMNALQEFSEKREALNRVAYAASLLREQQAGRGGELVKAHDWIDTTGLDESSALGKIARDVEVDYKWVSKSWSRYVSGLAAPFGTWYFKMSNNIWRWALRHWGKALVTFLATPIVSTFYNDRSKESRDLEKGLPDSIRNRVHFVLGKTPDGKTRVLSLQLPQDALIGTKIFTIATAYVNRVALGEMTAEEAAIKTLKQWGYKETAGTASLMAPIARFIVGLASADRRDPYDKSPVYSKDPKDMTAWEYRKQTVLYGIKVMTPFLSASISSYEKGLPQDMAWKQSLDTIIGKRALGFYDINPKNEIEVELEDGKKIMLSWDDNAKIEWIYQQESHILDHFEDVFVASGKSPEEFYKTPQAQNQLLNVHKLWNTFAPDLNTAASDTEKAEFVVGQLGERLLNRIFSAGTLSKWYQVKLNRAGTDEEKTKLGQEYKRLMAFKIEEAIKKQPKTSRQAYMAIKLADSNVPVELLWKMP